MKNSTRWVLFLAGIGVLILGMYYFVVPSWPVYSMAGWRSHHLGSRVFPWGSFLGLLITFILGLALYKLVFRSSDSNTEEKKDDFCPYCGRDFQRGESISGVCPEDFGKEKL